ncbi:MAG: GNAT family N-acetyltransferase, partial [Candidatus Thorarchaeota archaeon]
MAGMAAGVAVTTPAQEQALYQDLVSSGATPEQAALLSPPIGLLISSVEVVGGFPLLKALLPQFSRILTRGVRKEVVKLTMAQLLRKGVKTFTQVEIAEALEEVTQDAIQNATVRVFDENRDMLESIPETFLRTVIATAPYGVLGGGAQVVRGAREGGAQPEAAPTVRPKVSSEAGFVRLPGEPEEGAGLPDNLEDLSRLRNELARKHYIQKGEDVDDRLLQIDQKIAQLRGEAPVVGRVEGVAGKAKTIDDILSEKHPKVDAFVSERNDSIKLHTIEVPKALRRKGIGTAYMEDLIAYADEVGKTVTLSTGGRKGDISKTRLIAYYKSLGFVENKGRNKDFRISDTMYRRPVIKPPTTEAGQPEAGLQPSMLPEEIAAREVR